MGVIAVGRRGEPARQAGRHLRAPQRADVGGRQGPDADRRARRSSATPRGTLAEQIDRAAARRGRRAAVRAARVAPRGRRRVAVESQRARSRRVQRHRRVHAATAASTSSRPRADRAHAGAVGQRARQSVVRHRRQRERRRVHVVRERARVPADARGTTTRSATRAARRSTCATRTTAGSGRRRRCRPRGRCRTRRATASATASSSTTRTASRRELRTYVATDAPVKFVVLKLRNRSGAAAAAVAHRATSSSCSATQRAANAAARRHRARPEDRRAVRAQRRTTASSPTRVAFLDCSEAQRTVTGDRTEFLGRNGSAGRPGVPCAARGCPAASAPALDPCLAMQVHGRARRRAGARDRVHVRLRPRPGRRAPPRPALPRHRRGARRARGRVGATGTARSARSTCRRPTRRSTSSPTAGCSTRCSRAGCGAAAASTSPAARSASATSCRTRWRSSTPSPRSCASSSLRARGAPVPRGRRPALVASAARARRAHAHLRRLPVAPVRGLPLRRRARRHRRARREGPVPRRPRRSSPTRTATTTCPRAPTRSATLYEHCVRAIQHGLRFGAHGLPLMGSGDWNDGMNLVGEHGKGESVWLAFFLYDVLVQFEPARARARRSSRSPTRARPRPRQLRANIEQHAWDGDVVPPRLLRRRRRRSARRRTPSARSTRCRRAGRSCPAPAIPSASQPGARRASTRASCDATCGVIQLFDPPFDKSRARTRLHQGLRARRARERRPVHARRRLGGRWRSPPPATSRGRGSCSSSSTRSATATAAAAIATYKVEPYVVAADVYTNPQHAGRGGWTWYTGSAGWMYRLITESLLGLRLEVDRLRVEPAAAGRAGRRSTSTTATARPSITSTSSPAAATPDRVDLRRRRAAGPADPAPRRPPGSSRRDRARPLTGAARSPSCRGRRPGSVP